MRPCLVKDEEAAHFEKSSEAQCYARARQKRKSELKTVITPNRLKLGSVRLTDELDYRCAEMTTRLTLELTVL
jgi:hypothetical protein